MSQCLEQNRASISPGCKASLSQMQSLLGTRAQARAAVMQICRSDVGRLCQGVVTGDGNLMECYSKAKARFSAACQKAVADAGYEATIDASASTTQVKLSSGDLINSLQGVEQAGTDIDGRAPAPDGAAKPERSGPRQPDEPRAFDRRA